jgi:hypothetical protein
MYRYKITGDTSFECVISNNATPQEGWYVSEEPVLWAEKVYVDGEVVDKPKPEVVIPEPPPPYVPPVPTAEEVKQSLINAVQSHLDSVARSKGYDGIISAASYAPFSNVLAFQNEGMAYGTWRSDVWAFCYAYLAEVQAGTKSIPTASELVALLPTPPAPIEWVVMGNNA